MIHLLLKILGARSADALEIAAWSLEFRGPNRGLIWLLGLALARVSRFTRRARVNLVAGIIFALLVILPWWLALHHY